MVDGGEHLLTELFVDLLEAEPSESSSTTQITIVNSESPNIPAQREQLAVLVTTGKAKEIIGVVQFFWQDTIAGGWSASCAGKRGVDHNKTHSIAGSTSVGKIINC